MIVRQRHNKTLGFTLLEILTALAIFAMISATLAPVLYNASRVSERTYKLSEKLEHMKTSEALVRRLIAAAIIPGKQQLDWRFDANQYLMRFLVVDEIFAGPALVELRAIVTGATQELVITAFSIDDTKHKKAEITLFDGYKNIDFTYFGDVADVGVKTWHTNWLSHKPPEFISIKLTPDDGNVVSIEVASLVSGAYFCDYDSTARTCRQTL